MNNPTKELLLEIANAIYGNFNDSDTHPGLGHLTKKEGLNGVWIDGQVNLLAVADAAIRAYEAHRPRPVVVLSREEWETGIDLIGNSVKLRDYRIPLELERDILQTAILGAFRWIKVEGE